MRLLAKSSPREIAPDFLPESVFLPGHLREVHDAALAVLECTGVDQLKALGLEPTAWLDRFSQVVRLAAALHDLGKANDHFQGIVQDIPGRHGKRQGLRHEWVTLLLLSDPDLGNWLSPLLGDNLTDRLALECAITGHHPAYGRPSPPRQAPQTGEGSEIRLFLEHPDFVQSLQFVARTFGLSKPPVRKDLNLSLLSGPDSVFLDLNGIFMTAEDAWEETGAEERRFVAAVKACVVAADVAGSALPKKVAEPEKRTTWVRNAFAAVPKPEQIEEVIRANLSASVSRKMARLRPFQEAVAREAGEVTLVKAGCGSGKTLAAYHWAQKRCPNKRLYFCYPTTGTATEGYRDYLFDSRSKSGRFGAELFHGRAEVDLDMILGVEQDARDDQDSNAAEDAFARIESLNAWSTPIVSCTVDMVLGIVQNHRRGLYSWPALAGAAFVFDEIHAYDRRLFGALLHFLESVRGVPVLLMTASLPRKRLEDIEERLARRGSALTVPKRTSDLKVLEERPRYRRFDPEDVEDPLSEVLLEVKGGGKVLWVSNTVDRAIDAAEQSVAIGLAPIIYHSRFRYEDRIRRHKEVIGSFGRDGPAMAVCTQVAEMSLNLSATLLVTDLAPVPSLIQRLGRLNRRANDGDATRAFLIVEPKDRNGKILVWPYDPTVYGNWPEASKKWLARLPGDSISQTDLAGAWEALQADESEPAHDPSAWLAGGPTTQVLELRTGSPGLTVILERDLAGVASGSKRLTEVVLPMPPPPNGMHWKTWKRYKGVSVAPEGAVDYDEKRGARWERGGR